MQWLAELCVKRPIFATVLVLVICVVGVFGYTKLGVDRIPKVDLPIVVVTTRLPGAAPEDVETEITDRVEEAVNTISGIDELRSISAEGISQVVITFVLEKSVDVGSQEVRDRLNAILPLLPRNVDMPIVTKVDPDASPIVYVALRSEKPVQEITEYADKTLRRKLENVSGVGQILLVGARSRQVNIWLDPIRMRAANVTAMDVQRAIQNQNLTVPGGRVESGPTDQTLRIHGRVENPDEIGSIVVRQEAGHPIQVRDVARVQDASEEQESIALRNGEPAVVLAIRKQSGSNTVEVADGICTRLEDLKSTLPVGFSLEIVRDDSGVIRTSVNAVKEHLAVGAMLAALVVLLFLGNFRSTIIAAVAIPTSIIGTFALMWIQDFTLNTITLLALALAVGIVIDDAIVVLENIFRYVEEKGQHPRAAAIAGTKEIGLAVLATTLSLIAVFMPVAFMGGIPGRFLKSFGVTMAFAIAVSLLVSFTLTPMMASRWLKAKAKHGGTGRKPVLERAVDWFYRPIEGAYMVVLRFVMKHRWLVVLASVLTLVSSAPLAMITPKGFLPRNDEAHFEIGVRAPEGSSLDATGLLGERIARSVRDVPSVESTLLTVAGDDQRVRNLARIYVRLTPPETRSESQEQLMNRVRETVIAKLPKDLRVTVSEVAAFGAGMPNAKVQYTITGPELRVLEKHVPTILEKLKAIPGAVDVDSSMIVGKPELGVFVDRARAADLGVSVADIANTLRLLVEGFDASAYQERGEQYDIHLRAEKEYRADVNGLRLLTVPSTRVGQVALSDLVELRAGEGPSVINRLNRRRQVTIMSNVAPGYGDSAVADEVKRIIAEENLPAEYIAAPAGQTREMGRTLRNFGLAFLLSGIFMYLVLAAQFESWLHPITIMLSLPLTLPFALLSIILFRQALDIYSALGILVLFGVVKKNAILQIDHTNQLRREGTERLTAILQANKDRLRPILMTTLSFVAGMIPLVLSRGVGAGYNRATAGVVVGGQLLSLLLTLLATPVAYSLFDDLSAMIRRLLGIKRGEFDPEEKEPVDEGERQVSAPV